MNPKVILTSLLVSIALMTAGCSEQKAENVANQNSAGQNVASQSLETAKVETAPTDTSFQQASDKKVIYQVFTRLFGNRNLTNKQWGTKEENGVGKFSDFTPQALDAIKQYGTTHIWYTGVPHHALVGDYRKYGISLDDPDVIKGRAGSPYAVKDYYNVNPDLADDPAKRLEEFKSLIERTHQAGMKVIIDIVPNHVARNYQSISKPEGVEDFGANDDKSVEYSRDNNFYYVVGQSFKVPEPLNGYLPVGGDKVELADGKFDENPAKWTGNGARKAQPHFHDWYETVKVNYGVRPDGTHDFDKLPEALRGASYQEHAEFWADKDIPNSWGKFKEIVLYWTAHGVDGFRYDMAEMVPVEFWSYLNSSIKMKNPNAFLLAEVYNPKIYRDYLQLGLMDSLYDKVDFYDTIKLIMQNKAPTSKLTSIVETYKDIDEGMLHFLENHDEQRIASPDFAGDPLKGKPAMVVSTLIGKGATLLYFAQAFGEAGEGDAGFGDPTRTTIFDYWGLANLKRWDSGGQYDGSELLPQEKSLQTFYQTLLSFSSNSTAISGEYADLHAYNLQKSANYNERLYSFARWSKNQSVIVLSNFDEAKAYRSTLTIPKSLAENLGIGESTQLNNIFNNKKIKFRFSTQGEVIIDLSVQPLESMVLEFNP